MNKEKCKFCNGDEVKCIRQYSDDEGKIITEWRCRKCGKKFITRW